MYKIEVQGMDKLLRAIERNPRVVFDELSRAIKTSVNIIRPIMRQEAPVGKSHALSRNIYAKAQGLRGEVGPDLVITPYAWYVHEGTKPYTIRPKLKKALYWNGAPHPFKKVEHPGIRANPFVERTFQRIEKPVENIFQSAIDRVISRFHNG